MLKQRRARLQRGLSLVELMVGIAVGLFVVAAASTLVATQLADNRRLLLEVQVQQDLRATADIITRDLRRIGSWGNPIAAQAGVWSSTVPATSNSTPQEVTLGGGPGASSITYNTSRTGGTVGPYKFRLNGSVIQSDQSGSGWQALTDENTMRVTFFSITAEDELNPAVRAACTKLCSDGTQSCWPTIAVRTLRVEITGEARSDSAVKRSVLSRVRLRNDNVSFNDPSDPTRPCPI